MVVVMIMRLHGRLGLGLQGCKGQRGAVLLAPQPCGNASCRVLQVVALLPHSPEAAANLASMYKVRRRLALQLASKKEQGAHNSAVPLQLVCGHSGGSSMPVYHLSPIHAAPLCAQDMGHHDAAIPIYRRALTLRPDFPEAFAHLVHSMQVGVEPRASHHCPVTVQRRGQHRTMCGGCKPARAPALGRCTPACSRAPRAERVRLDGLRCCFRAA